MYQKRLTLVVLVLVLTACAQPAFKPQTPVSAITPQAPPQAIERAAGEQVIWGGVVVGVNNLDAVTELEILAHPLDRSQRPQLDLPAYGRFIARSPGFLDPVTFARGRQVTVLGDIRGLTTGKVGEASYRYPVIETEAVHLWDPEQPGADLHFGVGIGIFGD